MSVGEKAYYMLFVVLSQVAFNLFSRPEGAIMSGDNMGECYIGGGPWEADRVDEGVFGRSVIATRGVLLMPHCSFDHSAVYNVSEQVLWYMCCCMPIRVFPHLHNRTTSSSLRAFYFPFLHTLRLFPPEKTVLNLTDMDRVFIPTRQTILVPEQPRRGRRVGE